MRAAHLATLLASLLLPLSSQAQQAPPRGVTLSPGHGLDIASARSDAQSMVIGIRNWGGEQAVRLSCSTSGSVVRCAAPGRIRLNRREDRTIPIRYATAGVGRGSITIVATSDAGADTLVMPIDVRTEETLATSEPLSIQSLSMEAAALPGNGSETTSPPIVTPEGQYFSGSPNTDYSLPFTVRNPNTVSKTYSLTCGGAYSCTVLPRNLTVGAQGDAVVQVYFTTTSSPGDVSFTATHETDGSETGFYSVAVLSQGAPTFSIKNENSYDLMERSACVTTGAGLHAFVQCAEIMVPYSMPAYRSLNREHGLTLVYNGATAQPYPVVFATVSIPDSMTVPDELLVRLVSGNDSADYRFSTSGLTPGGPARRIAVPSNVNGVTYTTRLRNFQLRVFSVYGGTQIGSSKTGRIIVINRVDSPYGRGWDVAGVSRIYSGQVGNRLLLVEGDGSAAAYDDLITGSLWRAPPGTHRDSISYGYSSLPDGTSDSVYVRTLLDRTRIYYDRTGLMRFVAEPVGNYQRVYAKYAWERIGTQDRLLSIQVPPASANALYRFYYDAAGKLDRIVDPAGRALEVTVASTEVQFLDPGQTAGNEVEVETDANGRVNRIVGRDDFITSFSYKGSTPFVSTASLPSGAGTTTLTPAVTRGLATSTTSINQSVPTDQIRTTIDGPRTDVTDVAQFYVNQYGAPDAVTDPLGFTTELWYDANAPLRVQRLVHPFGVDIWQEWDGLGRLMYAQRTHSSGTGYTARVDYEYAYAQAPHRPSLVIAPREGTERDTTRLVAQADGLLDYVDDPRGARTDFSYNSYGQVSAVTDYRGKSTQFEYVTTPCAAGGGQSGTMNLSAVVLPRGGRNDYEHDAYGNVCRAEAEDGSDRQFQYGPTNRLTQERVLDTPFGESTPRLLVTQFIQDANGRDTARIDPRTVRRSWRYDGLGRVTRETDEFGMSDSWTYGAEGLRSFVDRAGYSRTFYYDAAGRDTLRVSSGPNSGRSWGADRVRTTYNSLGLPTLVENEDVRVTREWNVEGTLRSETQVFIFNSNQALTYQYEYTPADLRAKLTTPGGRIVDFRYGRGAVLDTARTGTRVFSFTADRAGRDSIISYPNGLVARFLYDDDGNLGSLTATRSSRQGDFNYSYDLRGRPISMAGHDWDESVIAGEWEYDLRGEVTYNLMEQLGRTVDARYGYDPAGNRVHETTPEEEYEYRYGGMPQSRFGLSNRLDRRQGLTDDDWTTYYSYEANGNLARDSATHAELALRQLPYFYTGHNQLATNNGSNDVPQYRYDGLGRLVHRRGGIGVQVRTSFDGTNVGTVDGMDVIQRPGAVDQPLVLMNTEADPCYYVTYGPRLFFAVHEAGDACTARATWSSSGKYTGPILLSQTLRLERSPSDDNRLSPFRNRYYDSETGRFTQEDPAGFAGGHNLYAYAGNNPAVYTDPFGLCPPCNPAEYLERHLAGWQNVASDALASAAGAVWDRLSGKATLEALGPDVQIGVMPGWIGGPGGAARGFMNNRMLNRFRIGGRSVAVDAEVGGSGLGQVHVHITGRQGGKFLITNPDDLSSLPRSVRNNTTVQDAIQRGFEWLSNIR